MNLTKRSCLIAMMTLFLGAGTGLAQSRIQLAQGRRVIEEKVSFVINVGHDKTGDPRYAEAPEEMRVWMRFADRPVSGKVYVDGKAIGRFDQAMGFNSNSIDISYGRHTILLTVSGPATLYDLYVDLRGGVAHEILDDQDLVAPPPSPALSKRVADLEQRMHDLETEIATLKKKRNH
jgi:hypothetical protein